MDKPLTLTQVAERFGKKRSWMNANIKRLRRSFGFPGTIPGFGNVYDPVAIEAWLAKQREPQPAIAAATEVAGDVPVLDWETVLDQRAAALAPAAGQA